MEDLDPAQTEAILRDAFPEECDRVGGENVSDLAHGHRVASTDPAGARFDVAEPIALLANAVTIAGFTWQLLALRRREPKPPAAEQIDELVLSAVPESAALPREKRIGLYVSILAARKIGGL